MIARTVTCAEGKVRMEIAPEVPDGMAQDLTQTGSWRIVSGTGAFEGLRGTRETRRSCTTPTRTRRRGRGTPGRPPANPAAKIRRKRPHLMCRVVAATHQLDLLASPAIQSKPNPSRCVDHVAHAATVGQLVMLRAGRSAPRAARPPSETDRSCRDPRGLADAGVRSV